MRINHNFCIKLVRLVIFIYDARSHIRQKQDVLDVINHMYKYGTETDK